MLPTYPPTFPGIREVGVEDFKSMALFIYGSLPGKDCSRRIPEESFADNSINYYLFSRLGEDVISPSPKCKMCRESASYDTSTVSEDRVVPRMAAWIRQPWASIVSRPRRSETSSRHQTREQKYEPASPAWREFLESESLNPSNISRARKIFFNSLPNTNVHDFRHNVRRTSSLVASVGSDD